MKARIVERTKCGERVSYVIQQKFLFWWVDAYKSSSPGCWGNSFYSLETAKRFFYLFDSRAALKKELEEMPRDRVVFE